MHPFSEKVGGEARRIEIALIKFAKEKGAEIAGAIVHDIVVKAGFKETFTVIRDSYKSYSREQSGKMLAQEYIHQHQEEAVFSYLEIYKKLSEEFGDRKFVLIFDQFESANKGSVDFLINICRMMPDNFHVVVSVKTEEDKWSDTVARELYLYAKRRLEEAGAWELPLRGLSTAEIGQWIRIVRGVSLPSFPDLSRIKESTAGFPIILNEWISQSERLDYDEIDRSKLCKYIGMRTKALTNEEHILLNKISVLLYPLSVMELAGFLNIKFEYLRLILDKLKELGIFERKNGHEWFKHELVQKCIEDALDEDSVRSFHNDAANFYLQKKEGKQF